MNPGEFSQIRRRGAPAPAFETSSTTYSYPTETFESINMPIQSNSGRDRTLEFANTVRSLQGRTFNQEQPINVSGQGSKNRILAQQNREFMTIAANIGKNMFHALTGAVLIITSRSGCYARHGFDCDIFRS